MRGNGGGGGAGGSEAGTTSCKAVAAMEHLQYYRFISLRAGGGGAGGNSNAQGLERVRRWWFWRWRCWQRSCKTAVGKVQVILKRAQVVAVVPLTGASRVANWWRRRFRSYYLKYPASLYCNL
jgi:hypothetical protein